jgi:ubiquinone/menaquinone biosynthesis C-methylase UbiE
MHPRWQDLQVARDVYTHGHEEAVLRSHRWRTAQNSAAYLLDHLRPGDRLLDIGCGPGTLTLGLARAVSPGEVVGVDIARDVIAEASANAVDLKASNVVFQVGDFRQVGLEAGSFDVVHAHQVLQHLADPVGAMREMASLVRRGGIVAVRDSDYGAFTWSPSSAGLDRWREVYSAVARHNRAEPNAGRLLLTWAQAAGWPANAIFSSSTWTFATFEETTWWAHMWADRCTASSFARQAIDYGISTAHELQSIADEWRRWADSPGAVFIVLHGELIGRF